MTKTICVKSNHKVDFKLAKSEGSGEQLQSLVARCLSLLIYIIIFSLNTTEPI